MNNKAQQDGFVADLIQEECKRDPVFRREYEAEKLADQLRRARAQNRITVESVAKAINTAQPSITRMEGRPETVALGRFIEYAHALGYEVSLKKSSEGPTAAKGAKRAIRGHKKPGSNA